MARLLTYCLMSIWVLLLMNISNSQSQDVNVNININIKTDSCVSGDMKVKEKTKGIVRVSELSEGDVITGIMGDKRKPTWCNVVAVFLAANGRNKTTHDGFTPDHMVIDHTVHPYGKKGEVRIGPVYTLPTAMLRRIPPVKPSLPSAPRSVRANWAGANTFPSSLQSDALPVALETSGTTCQYTTTAILQRSRIG